MSTQPQHAPVPRTPPGADLEPRLPQPLTRRHVLRGAVVVSGVSAMAVLGLRTSSSDAALATVTGCTTLTPSATQGPFWVDEKLNRTDIRADSETGAVQAGIPLTLTINLTDATGGCTPQAGAFVDIWHANARGAYSAVSGAGNPDNRDVDWLRGYQVSDSDGQVTFTTIFPGWYVGRTIHIHFRVRTSLSTSTEVNFTSQLFFKESINNAVVATSAYSKSGTRTTNSTDSIYDASLVVPVTGNTSTGYTGAITVNLDFADGASTTTPTATATPSATAAPTAGAQTVGASLLSAVVVRRGRTRRVRATITTSEVTAVRLRLVRDDDIVLVRRQWGWLSSRRRRTLKLRVPRSVRRGPAEVMAVFADRAGNTRVAQIAVTVPAR